MMETKGFNTWGEFEEQVCRPLAKNSNGKIWFRGHADVNWELESTLHRKCKSYDLKKYLSEIGKFYTKAKSFANLPWELDHYNFDLKQWDDFTDVSEPGVIRIVKPIIEYMAYLRHHGYPSPLLDWTSSPYVAAFFAYSEDVKNVNEVAIFRYQEMPEGKKFVDYDEGYIVETVDYPIETHKRHFLQQSHYAVALQNVDGYDQFVSFEDVSYRSNKDGEDCGNSQDVIVKYVLPKSERKKVLRSLDLMNISYLSLFDDEQALVDTLALQTFDLK